MNSKEEQTNSEATNVENESLIEQQKDPNYINEQIGDNKLDKKSIEIKDEYKFGWSSYSEITNGRFAMIGFLAIILIELFSKQSFLKWAGIL
ncbi:putative high light inducible protein [Prochlorococcus marinus str. MIT 9321]|uniref:Putative high light inducible protein n=1 Tax=Prochlorococcus marinus str. MIT 9401 TaxID=167551 RepID=A0A0A2B0P4_PROMR|nr:chlorophyll a/b-binding protein [Prochlorococcus marinus]KGG05830.1 putative high light inducible protein [Prochlorococcus marinus str. MIT 9321]KGG06144.1 putative high light inducible protein [Prochlorococcus marinus str. MIT 9322]KGG06717.1 putative high light inducible protein [Prochlorococcus marinus str. MIT 9401]